MIPGKGENRNDVRFATSGPALLVRLHPPQSCRPAAMVDVSFGGLLVELQERPELSVGSKVQVRFGRVVTTGEVRHVTERESGFAVGVHVTHVEVTAAGLQTAK